MLLDKNQRDLFQNWIFKGGTCLKKCYFKYYRFSEDLDFSLVDRSQMNEKFLKNSMINVIRWLYEEIGLEISSDGILIDLYKNKQNNTNAQVSLKYCGPLHRKSKASLKVL